MDELGYRVPKKINVWNPTMANLTLMALGSSAPEILLSTIGAITTLGEPGDALGPSTIVGSASFNLLVISAVSVISITPENDNKPDRDNTVPVGVKKINDLGVFAVTTISSLWAYIWMFLVLEDKKVTVVEGVMTFAFFVIMVICALIADKINARKMRKENEDRYGGLSLSEYEKQNGGKAAPVTVYQPKDFYKTLIDAELNKGKINEADREKAD